MSQLRAVKYSGAGNLIILILEKKDQISAKTALAKKLCDSSTGPGADGVLFLREDSSKKVDYIWDFYNADGSSAEMCGNAARNAGQFCNEELKIPKDIFLFQTVSGKIFCEKKENGIYEVEMPPYHIKDENLELVANGQKEKFMHVDTGVPHLVCGLNENLFAKINEKNFLYWAQSFRSHSQLDPLGANVTVVNEWKGEKQAVTFERGVENFTQACGTGAVAAAVYFEKRKISDVHEIKMPGGLLKVDLKSHHRPHLVGPSKKIEEYSIEGNI